MSQAHASTTAPVDAVVVEPAVSGRVRRPSDAYALVLVIVVIVLAVTVADPAVGQRGLDEANAGTQGALPRALLLLLSWTGGLGLLVALVIQAVSLLVRGRAWQLFEAVVAAGAGTMLAQWVQQLAIDGRLGDILGALTNRVQGGGRTTAVDSLLVASVAFFTVSGIGLRPVLPRVVLGVIASAVLSAFLSGAVTALALFVTLLLGRAVGLAVRLALGTASSRPPGAEVVAALRAAGVDLDHLQLLPADGSPERRYAGSGPGGLVDVRVLDRDTFGSGAARRILRRAGLRGSLTRGPSLTIRSAVEHRALMALAVEHAGVSAPTLLAAAAVGRSAAVLAYRPVTGRLLATQEQARTGEQLTDEDLRHLWHLLEALQRAGIAHRGLSAEHLAIDATGRPCLTEAGEGDVAAKDLSLRLDVAQLLTTLALLVGPERAVAGGAEALGPATLARALPLLQAVAMGRSTRVALRADKGILRALREQVLALSDDGATVEQVELRRLTPRAFITVVGGGIAAYFLLSQLASVDLRALRDVEVGWALAVVALTFVTVGATSLVITGAVPARLRFRRTYMTQLTVAFSGLVAPAAVGNIALNMRYLVRAGVDPAVAGGSMALAQLAQFSSYFVLLLVSSVLAGTGELANFSPPQGAVVGLLVVVALVLLSLAVPAVRNLIAGRVVPLVRRVVPLFVAMLQNPRKMATLFGGALLLDAAFVAALVCATRAFGADSSVPAIAAVYFAGAIIGSAVPTPGGLGGVEAALSAGLIAIGLESSVAVPAVLLFRLCTYWLPIPFGWASLTYLQRRAAI